MISAVRRMSHGCALRKSAHAAPDALTRRPASFYAMRLSSLQHVTYAIADAMLAGPAEPDSIVERMTRCLGVRSEWMRGLARKVAKRFGARWDSVDRKEVSMLVAGEPGFVAAWRSDMRPVIVQVLRRAPTQQLPPPRLREVTLPQLPTLAGWKSRPPILAGLQIAGVLCRKVQARHFTTTPTRRLRSATDDVG